MNPNPEPPASQPACEYVLSLLEQWRVQTLAESDALRNRNWGAVRACQQIKQQLQALLAAEPGGKDTHPHAQLLPVLDELLALEARNRDWLAERKTALNGRRAELIDSARNLQRLRNSYAPREQAAWQSYG